MSHPQASSRYILLALGCLILTQSCSEPATEDSEWVEDDYLEYEDKDELVLRKESNSSARPDANSQKLTPEKHEYEGQNYADDIGFFFDAYPPTPLNPPGIMDREGAYGFTPKYGVKEYLPTVPLKMTGSFPKDYVGVERWNREFSLPVHPDNYATYSAKKPLTPAEKKVAEKGKTQNDSPLNPSREEFQGAETSIFDKAFTKDPTYQRYDLGPYATFSLNFLGDLRGASYSLGVGGFYVLNKNFALDGWFGYRRLVVGRTGANKDVLYMNNLALGITAGPVFFVKGPQHLRVGLGTELDYNWSTTRRLAGGGSESYSEVNSMALALAATWQFESWAIFAKYHGIFHKLSVDHPSLLHIGEVGVTVYVL